MQTPNKQIVKTDFVKDASKLKGIMGNFVFVNVTILLLVIYPVVAVNVICIIYHSLPLTLFLTFQIHGGGTLCKKEEMLFGEQNFLLFPQWFLLFQKESL